MLVSYTHMNISEILHNYSRPRQFVVGVMYALCYLINALSSMHVTHASVEDTLHCSQLSPTPVAFPRPTPSPLPFSISSSAECIWPSHALAMRVRG